MQLSGKEVIRLMRQHKVTIRDLKAKFQITLKRTREVRTAGVAGFHAEEWTYLITGAWPASSIMSAAAGAAQIQGKVGAVASEATYVAVQGPSVDVLQNDVLEYFKRTKSIPRVSLIQRAFRLGPHRSLQIMQDLVHAGLVKERPTTRGAMYSVVKHRVPAALGILRA